MMSQQFYMWKKNQMLTLVRKTEMKCESKLSSRKRRYCVVLCSGCNKEYEIQMSQFNTGHTEYCKSCSLKKMRQPLLKISKEEAETIREALITELQNLLEEKALDERKGRDLTLVNKYIDDVDKLSEKIFEYTERIL